MGLLVSSISRSPIYTNDTGISYGLVYTRRIQWDNVVEFSYLGSFPAMGFTDRAFFRTRDGKTHFLPIAHDKLRSYLRRLPSYKEQENIIR
jgi:hypothetical protein